MARGKRQYNQVTREWDAEMFLPRLRHCFKYWKVRSLNQLSENLSLETKTLISWVSAIRRRTEDRGLDRFAVLPKKKSVFSHSALEEAVEMFLDEVKSKKVKMLDKDDEKKSK